MIDWASGRSWQVTGVDGPAVELLGAVAAGHLGGVLLHGPAGVGKTLLASTVLAKAAAAGYPTARLVATPTDARVPLGALRPLLAVTDVPLDHHQLRAEGRDAVLALTGGRPKGRLVLVLDDVPLADPESAGLIVDLARSGLVFLLATARTGVSLPAAIDGALVEGTLASRPVAPLDRSQLDDAVTASLGAVEPDTLDRLWSLSDGIPLHARELVQTNVASGVLHEAGGVWAFRSPPVAPPTLIDLVASRFAALDGEQQRVFEALCLAQPLPLSAAIELASLDLLGTFEDGGLVEVVVEGGQEVVRLGHPLYDEVVRSGLGPLRRRQAAERAIRALRATSVEPGVALRAACIQLEHQLPIDPADGLAAARQAMVLLDPALAERLVLAAGGTGFDHVLLLGNAQSAQGRHEDAESSLRKAVELAADDEQRARAISRRGNNLGSGAGRFNDALEVLTRGLTMVEDPRWRSFLEADLAYVRLWAGEALGGEFLPAGSPDVDTPGEVRANECLVGAVVAAMGGQLARTEALVEEGLPLAAAIQSDIPNARELLLLSRVLALAFGGDAAGASSVVAVELERALGSSHGAPGTWLAVRAMQRLFEGNLSGSIADAVDAVRRLEVADVAGLRPFAQAVQASALAQSGDRAASMAAAAAVAPGWRDETKVQILLTQTAAWHDVVDGRVAEACGQLRRAAEVAFEADHGPLGATGAAYDAVRLGHPQLVLDVLAAINERWEGALGRALLDHARALAGERPHDLLEVARRLPALGCSVGAGEAAMQAARIFTAHGQVAEAQRAEHAAATIIAPLGAPVTPTLGRPKGLTARERQVAMAATPGRSSRSIADDLGISVRTVENHLGSIYRKLGIGSRAELRAEIEALGWADGGSPGER